MTIRARHNINKKVKNRVPLKYHSSDIGKSFHRLKTRIIHNKGVILKKLNTETRQKIDAIVKIESSIEYRVTRHIINRLDIFSRFLFPIIYLVWLNFTLFTLDYNYIRFTFISLLITSVVVSYLVMKIRDLKNDYKFSTWQAIKYYSKGKCCRLDKSVKLT